MVEGAPLLREYTSKGYRGFESHRLRHQIEFDRFFGLAASGLIRMDGRIWYETGRKTAITCHQNGARHQPRWVIRQHPAAWRQERYPDENCTIDAAHAQNLAVSFDVASVQYKRAPIIYSRKCDNADSGMKINS